MCAATNPVKSGPSDEMLPWQVRIQAQEALGKSVHSFPGSHAFLLEDLVQLLTPARADVTHEQFKGALYTLLGNKQRTLLVLCDWPFLGNLWPALVGARHSEKPSIIGLLEHILETLQKHLETIQLALTVGGIPQGTALGSLLLRGC